jgi:hypothetical protein
MTLAKSTVAVVVTSAAEESRIVVNPNKPNPPAINNASAGVPILRLRYNFIVERFRCSDYTAYAMIRQVYDFRFTW